MKRKRKGYDILGRTYLQRDRWIHGASGKRKEERKNCKLALVYIFFTLQEEHERKPHQKAPEPLSLSFPLDLSLSFFFVHSQPLKFSFTH